MRVLQLIRGGRPRSVRALVGLVTALVIAIAGLAITPTTATAADGDVVLIPDANLKAAANAAIAQIAGGTRTPTQDITEGDAKLVTGQFENKFTGPVADLTGLQAFTNATSLVIAQPGSTFSDLSPLQGLTKLTILTLSAAQVSDASPLANLTNLTDLNLDTNEIRDVSAFPALPNATYVSLRENKITNPGPLAGKFDPAKLATLYLGYNRITDASALAGLYTAGAAIGSPSGATAGLTLRNNRITDFSAFNSWPTTATGNRFRDQQIYVGPYMSGGMTIPVFKPATSGVTPALSPAIGSYDPGTGALSVDDPAAYSSGTGFAISPHWIVYLSNAPVDPTDPPSVTSPATKTFVVGSAITPFTVAATGGTTPYAWTATGFPAGLSINPTTGEVTGTPTTSTATPASITVTATDANSRAGSATFTITVTAAPTPATVTNPGSKSFPAGAAITPFTVTATGGTEPYAWSATGLPTGLTINQTSGAITGTPTAQGPATVIVTATDAASRTGSTTFTITINPPAGTVVDIPDANLKAAINAKIADQLHTTRTPTQDVTVNEAKVISTLDDRFFPGPVADLTGAEALANLTDLDNSQRDNTFSDLTPLAGLTKLTSMGFFSGRVTNLAPLAGLTNLTSLQISGNQVTDAAPLGSLTKLQRLLLNNNAIRDLSTFPSLPKLVSLELVGNRISDPAPLVGKFDPAVLETINLANNRIADASALDQLGDGDTAIESVNCYCGGLNLRGNRIADFSMFADWATPFEDKAADQQIYVGDYRAGGVTVSLKPVDGSMPAVTPSSAGAYDPATGKLTVTDGGATSVAVSPSWTVRFETAPADPGDPDGPVFSGTAQVGQVLEVTSPGGVFETTPCPQDRLSYRWLRDGDPFAGVPYFDNQFSYLYMGGPGTLSSYKVSATDLGRRLSVQVSCPATGVQRISDATAVVTQTEPEEPAVQALHTGSSLSNGVVQIVAPSGVVGDPTNPTFPIYVAELDTAGRLADSSDLTVTVAAIRNTASSGGTLETSDIQISTTGDTRTVTITPREAITGNTITLRVTGTTGKTTDLTVGYVASRATTSSSRVLLGSSDASTSIAVGDGYLMVGDDEKSAVGLYGSVSSGREVARFSIGETPAQDGSNEIDLESAARKGDSIWWLGSHGNSKDGEVQRSRHAIFQTTLNGSGADATLTPVGVRYGDLRTDLIAWDRVHGDRYGFAAGTANGQGPDGPAQFNIEGAEFSPDGSALYLGFRAPVYPAAPGGDALIVPLLNVEDLTSGAADRARFGDPIELDLGGQSIREIRKNGRGEYLIIGANAVFNREASPQSLWAWNGDPDTQPRRLTTELPLDVESQYTDNQGAWEGIGAMPDRLVPGADVQLIMDQGYAVLYGGGENKEDTNGFTNKARTDVVTLAGAVGTLAEVSGPGAFPDQVANTIGSAREVTVTNTGSNPLHVDDVFTTDDDSVSADDFLISGDTCSGKTLGLDDTCTIRVRFAPSRAGATSDADLMVESDVPGGSTTVPLSGKAIAAPTGGGGGGGGGDPTPPQKVNPAVSAGSTTVSAGQPATVLVQVAGSASAQPTGTVTLSNGSQSIGSATLAAGSATFTFPAAALTEGLNLFTVEYAGDTAYNGASTQVAVTVTTTQKGAASVSAGTVTVDYGHSAPVKVQVTGGGSAQPTGTVTLRDGDEVVGSSKLAQGAATITVPASALSVGVNLFTVGYAGDAAYNVSSTPVMVTVDKARAKVTAEPTGKVVARKKAALKVTVTGPEGVTPTGLVTVLAGGKATTVRLVNGQGTARFTFKTAGTRAVFLTYAGNADLSDATGTAKVKVTPPKRKKHQHQHGRASSTGLTETTWWAKKEPILN